MQQGLNTHNSGKMIYRRNKNIKQLSTQDTKKNRMEKVNGNKRILRTNFTSQFRADNVPRTPYINNLEYRYLKPVLAENNTIVDEEGFDGSELIFNQYGTFNTSSL
jgi:hypothetical protein